MEREDVQRFVVALVGLAETFGEVLSEGRIAGYVDALDAVPLAAALLAIKAARQTCTYFPRPAELLALGAAAAPDEGETYAHFAQLVRNSRGTAPPMPEGLRLIVERMGGWNALTNLDEEAQRRRFRDVFAAVRTACVSRGLALLPPSARPALGPASRPALEKSHA